MNNTTFNQFWKDCVLAGLRAGKGARYVIEEADVALEAYQKRLEHQAEVEAEQDLLATLITENKL